MEYKRISGNVYDNRNIEHMAAQADKTAADLAFATLMAGIEIPTEDDINGMGMEVTEDE